MAAKRPPHAPSERKAADDDPAAEASAPPPEAATGSTTGADGVVSKVRRAVHDLRQPVQAMRLFVHLLGTRLEREEDRALIGKLDEALENIEAALRGLMNSIAPPPGAAPSDDAPFRS
jgi:hypothetical protein